MLPRLRGLRDTVHGLRDTVIMGPQAYGTPASPKKSMLQTYADDLRTMWLILLTHFRRTKLVATCAAKAFEHPDNAQVLLVISALNCPPMCHARRSVCDYYVCICTRYM